MNFEELRNQFAILKDQLKKQEIVSDHLIRETMKAKKSNINSTKRMCYACAVIAVLFTPMNFYSHAWSLPFCIVTCLMMLFCAVATYYIHRPVDKLNFMTDDFATVARVMAKFKKQYDMCPLDPQRYRPPQSPALRVRLLRLVSRFPLSLDIKKQVVTRPVLYIREVRIACYNSMVVAPLIWRRKGGDVVRILISFLVSVMASVVGYYVCKWLDGDDSND